MKKYNKKNKGVRANFEEMDYEKKNAMNQKVTADEEFVEIDGFMYSIYELDPKTRLELGL